MSKVNRELEIIDFISRNLQRKRPLPHQAVQIALKLHELRSMSYQLGDGNFCRLYRDFLEKLSDWDLVDVLDHQIRYATTLAGSPGKLEYEELHKLFNLCREIEVLEELGLARDDTIYTSLKKCVGERIVNQRKESSMVLEDLRSDRKAGFWWFDLA